MSDGQIKAHMIAAIGGTAGSDGKVGLVKFVREKPMTNGESDIWMAVPHHLLPYLATVAVKLTPQPADHGATKDLPFVLDAKYVEFGQGPQNQLVLTVELEKGASLSFELDAGQAHGLASGIQTALGKADFAPPPGTKLS